MHHIIPYKGPSTAMRDEGLFNGGAGVGGGGCVLVLEEGIQSEVGAHPVAWMGAKNTPKAPNNTSQF